MITANEARRISEETYQNRLIQFHKNHETQFNQIEAKIKYAAEYGETSCEVIMSYAELEFNQFYYTIILEQLGYKVTIEKNKLILNWAKYTR